MQNLYFRQSELNGKGEKIIFIYDFTIDHVALEKKLVFFQEEKSNLKFYAKSK